MKKYVILVAGGAGQRMRTEVPKQFLSLSGTPVLMRAINAFYEYSDKIQIVVAIRSGNAPFWRALCLQYHFDIPHTVVNGGKTRFQSVKNALDAIDVHGLVAIHDGVRPLLNQKLINEAFTYAEEYGACAPVLEINDTIRSFEGDKPLIVDRNQLRSVQTPQVFNIEALKMAYEMGYQEMFTDDAAVYEFLGGKVHYFPGQRDNIKITVKEDLIIAEGLLKSRRG